MKCRTLSFLSVAALSLLTVAAVNAQNVRVSDAASLMRVFESADEESMGKNVVLDNNIDFSIVSNIAPFGLNSSGQCTPYRGKLQGNGYSLKGLTIDQSGNTQYPHAGLFCRLDGAVIENVVLDESCKMTGSDSGALAVVVTGSVTLMNVKSQATVTGTGNVGGLFARVESSSESSFVFDHCVVEEYLSSTGASAGGFVGVLRSSNVAVTFTDCESGSVIEFVGNEGMIGGFIGMTEKNENMKVSITNCITRGTINAQSDTSGDLFVAGLIGLFLSCINSSITVENVRSTGTITTEKTMWSVNTGGFFGYVKYCEKFSVTIQQSVSQGKLNVTLFPNNGNWATYTGGFIACINGNTHATVHIRDCVGLSDIYLSNPSDYGYTSGFIGRFSHNANSSITIEHCTNGGSSTFPGSFANEFYGGGFLGEAYENSGCSLTVKEVTNNVSMIVSAKSSYSRLGGLIGLVAASSSQKFLLEVRNAVNYGNLLCGGGYACGFFCTSENSYDGFLSNVHNSVNKGTLTGDYAYGSTNIVSSLNNVVSMGTLTGKSSCWSLPQQGTINDAYLLVGVCNTILSGTLFTKGSDGFYYTEYFNKSMDEELNKVSTTMQYGMVWDTELNLFNAIRVVFGSPTNRFVYVKPCDTLRTAYDILNKLTDELIPVNRSTWDVLMEETIIERDLYVAFCFTLKISGVLSTTILVEFETMFSDVEVLKPYLNERYVVFNASNEDIIYHGNTPMDKSMSIIVARQLVVSIGRPVNRTLHVMNGTTVNAIASTLGITTEDFIIVDRKTYNIISNTTMIESDTDIALCHELTLVGLMNSTLIIEHETTFSEIKTLEPYLNKKHAVIDSKDNSIVYNLNTSVIRDMDVIIKKTGRVVIEIEGVDESEVDVGEIIRVIEGATGGVHVIGVDVVYDENGKVTQVTVIVDGEESARDVVDAVEVIDKGEGCGAGILCRRGRVFVEGDELDMSCSPLFPLSITIFALMVLLSLSH